MQILKNEIVSSHELLKIGILKITLFTQLQGRLGLVKHYVRDKLILYVAKTLNTFLTYNHKAVE